MKDFVKWLGVNEKVAKVVVWLLIIMVMLIIFNTGLESLGFPYYAITYDNIVKLNLNKIYQYIASIIITILNFYCIILLVFRVKNIKKTLKYAILYLLCNYIVSISLGTGVLQIFIIIYCILFCYLYSNKNSKYILYAIVSIIVNVIVEGIWYMSKARFIDYSHLNQVTKSILSLDYFIIMIIIILVKEIYLKKRGEKNERISMEPIMDRRIQERKQVRKKNGKKSSKSS